jgi:hypothetical protein
MKLCGIELGLFDKDLIYHQYRKLFYGMTKFYSHTYYCTNTK